MTEQSSEQPVTPGAAGQPAELRTADQLLEAAANLPLPEVPPPPAAPVTPRQRRNVSLLAVTAGGLAVAVLALVLLVSDVGDQAEENNADVAELRDQVADAQRTRKALLGAIRDQRRLTKAVLRSNAQLELRVDQLTRALVEGGIQVPEELAELDAARQAEERELDREARARATPRRQHERRDDQAADDDDDDDDTRRRRRREPPPDDPDPPSPPPPEEPDPVERVLDCVERPLRCADDLPG